MEVLLSLKTEIPLYKCVECENIHFIDAIKVKGYFELQQNANLNLSYECIKLNDGYMVNAYLHIPFQADFLRKQLFFRKEFIANLKVSFSKKQHLFYLPAIDFRAKKSFLSI